MAGQTPNYAIRYPEMLDPANINVVQFIAEDSETQLGSLLDEVVSESAEKISWLPVEWTPVVTGMTLGNGILTGHAFRLGQLVWVDFEILANQSEPPTTAWSANTYPTLALPASVPISQTVSGGHNLASARRTIVSSSVLNMALELIPAFNTVTVLALQGPMTSFTYPAQVLGGTSVWGIADYVKAGLIYVTSAG